MIRIKQAETLKRVALDPDSVSFNELTQLANARKTVDDLGRRAAALPSSFKASDEKPDNSNPKNSIVVGWANPPKRLQSGEDTDD